MCDAAVRREAGAGATVREAKVVTRTCSASSETRAGGADANSANVLGLRRRGRQTCAMVCEWAGRE